MQDALMQTSTKISALRAFIASIRLCAVVTEISPPLFHVWMGNDPSKNRVEHRFFR